MKQRRTNHFRPIHLDALEPRVLLAAAPFLDTPLTLPAAYTAGSVAVGDQIIFYGAELPNSDHLGAEIYNFDTGQWTTKTFDHDIGGSVAVIGDEAIFAGNSAQFTLSTGVRGQSAVDIYNADTGQWSSGTLSSARVGMQTAVVGNKVLFIGGVAGVGLTVQNENAIDIYDTSDGTWASATLSLPRLEFGVASVDGKVLIAGGTAVTDSMPTFQPSDVVDVFSSATDEWSTEQMPLAVGDAFGVSVGNFALFADGDAGVDVPASPGLSAVEVYDAATDAWTTHNLSQTRREFGTAVVGNKAIFAGGYYTSRHGNGLYPSTYVDIFDSADGSWSVTHMPVAMEYVSAATIDNVVMFTGTQPLDSSTLAEFYAASTGDWSVTTLPTEAYTTNTLAVAGKFVASAVTESDNGENQATLLAADVFSPTDLPAPMNQTPADGSVLGPPPSLFRWTPTPGATSYDVYVDGTHVATASDNRWTPMGVALLRGSHTWFVVAHVDSGLNCSTPTEYYVHGLAIEGRIQSVNLNSPAYWNAKGTADVTINIANLANPPTSVGVAVYASNYGDLSATHTLLGGLTNPFGNKVRGTTINASIPLTIPIAAPDQYELFLVLRIRGSDVVIDLQGNNEITIAAPPPPSPLRLLPKGVG